MRRLSPRPTSAVMPSKCASSPCDAGCSAAQRSPLLQTWRPTTWPLKWPASAKTKAHALLGGEHSRTVAAPHDVGRVAGDPAVVADARTLTRASGSPACASRAGDPEARAGLAVSLAAEGRAC